MCNMWVLRDNASREEVQSWMREKQLLDLDHAHKKLAKDMPKIVFFLYLVWVMSILYAFGFRRLLRYIQNIFDFVLNIIIILLPFCVLILSILLVIGVYMNENIKFEI